MLLASMPMSVNVVLRILMIFRAHQLMGCPFTFPRNNTCHCSTWARFNNTCHCSTLARFPQPVGSVERSIFQNKFKFISLRSQPPHPYNPKISHWLRTLDLGHCAFKIKDPIIITFFSWWCSAASFHTHPVLLRWFCCTSCPSRIFWGPFCNISTWKMWSSCLFLKSMSAVCIQILLMRRCKIWETKFICLLLFSFALIFLMWLIVSLILQI